MYASNSQCDQLAPYVLPTHVLAGLAHFQVRALEAEHRKQMEIVQALAEAEQREAEWQETVQEQLAQAQLRQAQKQREREQQQEQVRGSLHVHGVR
jgi:hypothetical protein